MHPPPATCDRLLLAASLACLLFLALHARRAVWGREDLRHQRAYREAITRRSDAGEQAASRTYGLRLRQVVLAESGRIDRCVTCHVGMEDTAMREAGHPLRTHPGPWLQQHDLRTVGCTVCHDGDGRAVTRRAAHGRAHGRPLLPMPYLLANCVRCHTPEEVPELEPVRRGQGIFGERQCLICHELDRRGGRLAPDLTRIGDAHPNQKAPVSITSDALAARFGGNLNLAYLDESIRHPALQPGASFMPRFNFADEEVMALTVFLKSLSQRAAPEALQAQRWREATRPVDFKPPVMKPAAADHPTNEEVSPPLTPQPATRDPHPATLNP
jgi:hypothetical protein